MALAALALALAPGVSAPAHADPVAGLTAALTDPSAASAAADGVQTWTVTATVLGEDGRGQSGVTVTFPGALYLIIDGAPVGQGGSCVTGDGTGGLPAGTCTVSVAALRASTYSLAATVSDGGGSVTTLGTAPLAFAPGPLSGDANVSYFYLEKPDGTPSANGSDSYAGYVYPADANTNSLITARLQNADALPAPLVLTASDGQGNSATVKPGSVVCAQNSGCFFALVATVPGNYAVTITWDGTPLSQQTRYDFEAPTAVFAGGSTPATAGAVADAGDAGPAVGPAGPAQAPGASPTDTTSDATARTALAETGTSVQSATMAACAAAGILGALLIAADARRSRRAARAR